MKVPKRKLAWRAGVDLVSHAHTNTRPIATLCGEPIVLERLAWPPFRKCMVCSALAEEPKVVRA